LHPEPPERFAQISERGRSLHILKKKVNYITIWVEEWCAYASVVIHLSALKQPTNAFMDGGAWF
jgi:hypothetical protein